MSFFHHMLIYLLQHNKQEAPSLQCLIKHSVFPIRWNEPRGPDAVKVNSITARLPWAQNSVYF